MLCAKPGYIRLFWISAFLFVIPSLRAQHTLTPEQSRFKRFEAVQERLNYPVIKGGIMTGVLDVTGVDEQIDPNLHYRLIFNLSSAEAKGDLSGKPNPGLEEVARVINLHKAAGVADDKLTVAIVVHGAATASFLRQEAYLSVHGGKNPNLDLIAQLQEKKVHIIVCGQSLQLRQIERKDLIPGIVQAFGARTVISTYLLKQFVLFEITD